MWRKKNSTERRRRFGFSSNAIETLEGVDLSGKTYAITGTTNGIGSETARALALKGAHVVMLNRNVKASQDQRDSILKEKADAQIDVIECNLSCLKSVKRAAEDFKDKKWPLHVLVLNAGVLSPAQKTTEDGLESHFGVNHVAHVLLINELLPVLRQSAPSRIVLVSSKLHYSARVPRKTTPSEKAEYLCPNESKKDFMTLYSMSKMCNVLTAFKLHRQEHANGISVYVLHPGIINTSIKRDMGVLGSLIWLAWRPFTKTLSQGAATTVYCAGSPDVEKVSGKYWEDCWDDENKLNKTARKVELQDALWDRTQQIIHSLV
ncbi:unnamed protein product [Caenorhabditis auriculariae]|uniref:Uncharacterized protein n=1 Tax=Caenorhabditis auriculariae TaxID=2777116 RepID=A0A8S1GTW5_9PELO|nr:unnamed protein product [Caenorhabditis auriculariae]